MEILGGVWAAVPSRGGDGTKTATDSSIVAKTPDEEEELPGAPAGAGGAGGRAAKALEEEKEDVGWKEAMDLLRVQLIRPFHGVE